VARRGLRGNGGRRNSPAFAIVRVEAEIERDEERFTVTRIVWDEDVAEAEVSRLNELNDDKGCRYFWQATRAQARLGSTD
jgi:hypothetical protein